MSKVYCKNCKFNKSILRIEWKTCSPGIKKSGRENDYYCKNHKASKAGPDPKIEWMHELNKDNDCRYYKRKWWKFWRKG